MKTGFNSWISGIEISGWVVRLLLVSIMRGIVLAMTDGRVNPHLNIYLLYS